MGFPVIFPPPVDAMVKAMRRAMTALPEHYEVHPLIEDWLPLGRGDDRRTFNTFDEYWAARTVWLRMNAREREAHLAEREGGSSTAEDAARK